jgi:hypothetical protein
VNQVFHKNTQGVLKVFEKFMVSDNQGFNFKSALRVVVEAKVQVSQT